MTKTLEHSLEKFAAKHNRPLQVIIYNSGGTITCVPDEDGLLAPTKSMSKLRTLLMNRYGMNLKQYVDSGLLDVRIKPIFFMDSSQMVALDREVISKAVVADYELYDGALVLHGTDTGALTAQHLSVSLPYCNPIAMWERSVREKNFTKPVLVVSSQIPATFPMSDAANNVHIGIEVIADQQVGEAGLLTNNYQVLRGSVSTKTSEVAIPPYSIDQALVPIAAYTAVGLRYSGDQLETGESSHPVSVLDAARFEKDVLVVSESNHLNYRTEPRIIFYVSKGAGNVNRSDYMLLKEAEERGVSVFRVPIVGGRIPDEQIYDVPGYEFPALNMYPSVASAKGMVVLALEQRMNGFASKEFRNYMMQQEFSKEFLPPR